MGEDRVEVLGKEGLARGFSDPCLAQKLASDLWRPPASPLARPPPGPSWHVAFASLAPLATYPAPPSL